MKWDKKKDALYLACGHGTQINGVWDSGCAYGKVTEADLMLPIVKAAVALLRKSGVKVYTDADKNNNKNMIATVDEANKKKVSLYMSVHCDYKGARSGVDPLYVSASGKKFGEYVGKYVAEIMGMKYFSTKRTDLYELNATDAPSCILETGNIRDDLPKLKQSKKYGRAIAKAICKYIGVEVYVTKRTQLKRKVGETLAYMNKHNFKYAKSYKKCGTSWEKAKKTKRSNCATMICYAMQQMGLLKAGQIFWINGTSIKCVGSGTKAQIKKNFTIRHPKKSPKGMKVKSGVVCGYKDNAHTQMFVKWNKDKNPLWYSWGPSDVGKKQPRHKKSYDKKKIMTTLTVKE